jgi:predicted GNAT family acetyltransferase
MEIVYLAEGDNLVFAGKENMETVSSLYLAPHYMNNGDELCEIRNVFTKEKFRRRGNMDALMKEAFQCMQSEREPYTFLRPMEEKYFTPYGFVRVEEHEGTRINGLRLSDDLLKKANETDGEFHVLVKESEDYLLCPVKEENKDEVADFINASCKNASDCYILQSGHTVMNIKKNCTEKGGNLYTVKCGGKLVCVFAYSLVKQEIVNEDNGKTTAFSDKRLSFAVFADGFKKEDLFLSDPDNQSVMARIIDVRSMLSKVVCPKEFVMVLRIFDERIVENAGLYVLHCGPMGGKLTAIRIGDEQMKNAEGEKLSAEGEVTIENLTRFLFGFRKAEDCFNIYVKSKEEECMANLNALKCFEKPCIFCD